MASLSSCRLVILACSARKRPGPDYLPAIERYDGPLWQTLRAADPAGRKAKIAFLSAWLGFRGAAAPIEVYDARMTEEIAGRMKAGGLGMRWPQAATCRRAMLIGEHAGMHIASLSDFGRRPFSDMALVGGSLYLDVMRHFVGLFQAGGHVTAAARIAEINGSIGLMRRGLRLWIDRPDQEEP